MKRLRTRSIAIPIALGSMGAFGQSNEGERLYDSARVVEEILDTAESRKVQLIVMGTRGLLGSVTERVLGRAKVPVLAVK